MNRTGNSFRIRTMTREEVDVAVDWAAQEGWNPGLYDAEPFYVADPNGFLAVEQDGEILATVSSTTYGDTFGFMGFYIVNPAHRHQGFGMTLANAARDYQGARLIGIDGVLAMQPKYEGWGFRMAYCNARYEGVGGGSEPSGVVELSTVPWAEVIAYDTRHFPASRERFLRCWLSQPGTAGLAIHNNTKLQGYGAIRPCRVGYKIGPLFADTADVAETLFRSLAARAEGAPVYLDVPEPNAAAVALAERHGMSKVFATARMYNRAAPELPLDEIFGITSFELG